MLTDTDARALEPFIAAYEKVRNDEHWGADDLDLPFHPRRHREIWEIRRRTFQAFQQIAAPLAPGYAIDIGAGNCWMTRYLDRWGFDSIAIDVNIGSIDGLAAGKKFIDEGSKFLRIRSAMERLPFATSRVRLAASNASFHYASDFRASLAEFKRVLTPGGLIAILDTPVYENAADGERMMAERVMDFRRRYGISEEMSRKSAYLTFDMITGLAEQTNLDVQVHHVWPGWQRKYEEIRGRLAGRRVAQFPLIIFEKRSDEE